MVCDKPRNVHTFEEYIRNPQHIRQKGGVVNLQRDPISIFTETLFLLFVWPPQHRWVFRALYTYTYVWYMPNEKRATCAYTNKNIHYTYLFWWQASVLLPAGCLSPLSVSDSVGKHVCKNPSEAAILFAAVINRSCWRWVSTWMSICSLFWNSSPEVSQLSVRHSLQFAGCAIMVSRRTGRNQNWTTRHSKLFLLYTVRSGVVTWLVRGFRRLKQATVETPCARHVQNCLACNGSLNVKADGHYCKIRKARKDKAQAQAQFIIHFSTYLAVACLWIQDPFTDARS